MNRKQLIILGLVAAAIGLVIIYNKKPKAKKQSLSAAGPDNNPTQETINQGIDKLRMGNFEVKTSPEETIAKYL